MSRSANSTPVHVNFLQRLFHALSGAYRYLDVWKNPSEGNGYLDVLPEAPALPWSWLTEDDLDVYVKAFTATGFHRWLELVPSV